MSVRVNGLEFLAGLAVRGRTITASSDAVDVSGVGVIWFDTNGGGITVGGFTNGVLGQVVAFAKVDQANNLVMEHNEGTGTQKLFNSTALDRTYADFGGGVYVFDGTQWWEVACTL